MLPLLALLVAAPPSPPFAIELTSTLMPRLGVQARYTLEDKPWLSLGGSLEAGTTVDFKLLGYEGIVPVRSARAFAVGEGALPLVAAGPLELAVFATLGVGLDGTVDGRVIDARPAIECSQGARVDVASGGSSRVGVVIGIDDAWVVGGPAIIDSSTDLFAGVSVRF